jgi:hypothetical protein
MIAPCASQYIPNKTTVCRLVEKFMETGSVYDRKHVRPVTVLTNDMVCTVEGMLSQSPCKSLRRYLMESDLSKASGHRGTKRLTLRPLNFNQLETFDTAVTVQYYQWFKCFCV